MMPERVGVCIKMKQEEEVRKRLAALWLSGSLRGVASQPAGYCSLSRAHNPERSLKEDGVILRP